MMKKKSNNNYSFASKPHPDLPLFSITKKDFKIEWFSGKGAGGQSRNKNQNCCRLTHIETGITKTGQSNKNRESNKKEAFMALVRDKEFDNYITLRSSRATADAEAERQELEKRVNAMMDEKYLKIEYGE